MVAGAEGGEIVLISDLDPRHEVVEAIALTWRDQRSVGGFFDDGTFMEAARVLLARLEEKGYGLVKLVESREEV